MSSMIVGAMVTKLASPTPTMARASRIVDVPCARPVAMVATLQTRAPTTTSALRPPLPLRSPMAPKTGS